MQRSSGVFRDPRHPTSTVPQFTLGATGSNVSLISVLVVVIQNTIPVMRNVDNKLVWGNPIASTWNGVRNPEVLSSDREVRVADSKDWGCGA